MSNQPYRAKITGWGRYPVVDGLEYKSENLEVITEAASLCRGLGRSYGDSSLPARSDLPVADTTLATRLLSFDPTTNVLRTEAGVSLFDLNRVFLRRGWFVPVSPGTQFVTVGGMVASDVHGKNHHVDGCFGEHVRSLKLRVADGRILECSDTSERELFRATIGGMGLTGHILEVEFVMLAHCLAVDLGRERADQRSRCDGRRTEGGRPTVADDRRLGRLPGARRKLGRGILMKGRWADPDESPDAPPPVKRRFRVPLEFPGIALCRPSMKAFNLAYYWKHIQRVRSGILHPNAFFYPLDMLDDWNLIYGKRGFTQYQCVLPKADDNGPARRFLELFVSAGGMGFLCVIKDCGAEGKGMLSFPRPGISIAMDFPIHPRKTPILVDRLNELVIAEGGRIYLTKDTFTRPSISAPWSRGWTPSTPCAASGTRRPASAVPNRSDSWETPHERRAVWSDARHGAGPGPVVGGARRTAVSAWNTWQDPWRCPPVIWRSAAPAPVKTAYCDLLEPETFAPALDQAQQRTGRLRRGRGHGRRCSPRKKSWKTIRCWRPGCWRPISSTPCCFARRRESGCWPPAAARLCVFSSVAGERGRKPVVLYGAAKAGLSRYLEGLDHKFRRKGLKTVCVKPGFVKTGMTVGLKPPPFAGTPDEVARRVLKAIDRGWPEVYVPSAWRWVMCVIRSLPRCVMRRIEF